MTDFGYIPSPGVCLFVCLLFLFCIPRVFGVGLFFEMCNSFMEFLKKNFHIVFSNMASLNV